MVGGLASDAQTSADGCTSVGYASLTDNQTGDDNTAIGIFALANATGDDNTALGANAGDDITTGIRNIIIGTLADAGSSSAQERIALGYDVNGNADSSFCFGSQGTDSAIAFGATTITAPSDVRLKEDIEDEKIGLDFINDLRPVTFRWKKAKDVPSEMKVHDPHSEERVMNGKYNHGFIAQEVKQVIDKYDLKDGFDMWTEDEVDGRQRIGEASLMPLMVKAVQELSAKVEELESKLNGE